MFFKQNYIYTGAKLDEISQPITIRNEEQVGLGQTFLPGLQLPEDIPEGYQFESLKVTKHLSGRWEYAFIYKDIFGKGTLCISQEQEERIKFQEE